MDKDKLITIIIHLVFVLIMVGLVVLALAVAYWISVSNLPDWFKFYLLRG